MLHPRWHVTSKVIVLGEQGQGTLHGFVDLWWGIVVSPRPQVSALPVVAPPQLITNDRVFEPALLSRDVALVEGHLTAVELRPSTEPDVDLNWNNWVVSTWTRKVTLDLWVEDWRNDYNVCCPDVSVDQDTAEGQ